MTLGILARADDSGLAALTREVVRHLNPDRVLLIDMGSLNRGGYHPEWYDAYETTVTKPLMNLRDLDQWLAGLDNVFTAETFYDPRFDEAARRAGVHRTLYVMPELHDPSSQAQQAEQYFLPCEWSGRWGEYPVLPMPVALDRLPVRAPRAPAKTFFHLPAAAFHDRAGTEAVLAALPYVQSEVTVVIGGSNGKGEDRDWRVGNVTVQWLDGHPENYFDVWPDGIDCYVTPRRYGVLSLPMLEAAALGLPIISTDLPPQNTWVDEEALCLVKDARWVQMKGGLWQVNHPDPVDLAARIDALATSGRLCSEFADQNHLYAVDRSWYELLPQWRSALC